MLNLNKIALCYFYLIICMLALSGCKGCKADEEINNGNSDPSVLRIQVFGSDIANVLNEGLHCTIPIPAYFNADVQIQVRTASLDENNDILLDPAPFYEQTEEYKFNGNIGGEGGTIFLINVPEKGAYGLSIDIKLKDCHPCCASDNLALQCGGRQYDENLNTDLCNMGRPKVSFEKIFTSETRPVPNYDFAIGQYIISKACANCQSCGTFPCM